MKESPVLTPEEVKKVEETVNRVGTWLDSPEGQKSAKQALQEAEATKEQLRQARYVDPKSLDDPITI